MWLWSKKETGRGASGVPRRGFSLAEMLVAIGLLSVLVGSVFGFMAGLAGRRDALEVLTVNAAAGDGLMSNLAADIASSVAGAAGHGAGISGDAQNLRLLSRSGLIDPGQPVELVRAEYAFDAAARSVTLTRRAARGGRAGAGGAEVISDRVALLRFRYLSGGMWRERFDSAEAGGLPVAIEAAIWFGPPAPAPVTNGDAAGGVGGDALMDGSPPVVSGEPDRVRMFIVPDGPTGSWEDSR